MFWLIKKDESDESWISYKTLLFLSIVFIGTGYILNSTSRVISAIDDINSDTEESE